MTIEEIKQKVESEEYDFLRTHKHLGENIVLMGLGGSHAYGLATEHSDIDIRGVALDSKNDILMGKNFCSVENKATDTKIYSFIKYIGMLRNSNPNTLEILGLEPWQYLLITPIGQEILNNRELFISQLAITTFGAYANQQLSQLYHKATDELEQSQIEAHLLKTMEFMSKNFKDRYVDMEDGSLYLYIDNSPREDRETEIFMDVNLKHYPVRDYCSMWNELRNTAKQYDEKLGKRNDHASRHDKLGKHMSMLFYLYDSGVEILEHGRITTCKYDKIPFYRSVRAGRFLTENDEIRSEFFDVLSDYEKRFQYAIDNTSIPELPDDKKINEFIMDVHERRVLGQI